MGRAVSHLHARTKTRPSQHLDERAQTFRSHRATVDGSDSDISDAVQSGWHKAKVNKTLPACSKGEGLRPERRAEETWQKHEPSSNAARRSATSARSRGPWS